MDPIEQGRVGQAELADLDDPAGPARRIWWGQGTERRPTPPPPAGTPTSGGTVGRHGRWPGAADRAKRCGS